MKDREVWCAAVRAVAKSQRGLSYLTATMFNLRTSVV